MSGKFLSYLSSTCQLFSIHLLLVRAHLICHISSQLSSVVVYLVLVDGGCLNSLLLVDSIPSTLDRLFQNRDLDSIEFLDTFSHQWKVFFPLTYLGIHQCPMIDGFFQVFDLNTSIRTCQISIQYLDSHFHYRWDVSHLLTIYISDQ